MGKRIKGKAATQENGRVAEPLAGVWELALLHGYPCVLISWRH